MGYRPNGNGEGIHGYGGNSAWTGRCEKQRVAVVLFILGHSMRHFLSCTEEGNVYLFKWDEEECVDSVSGTLLR